MRVEQLKGEIDKTNLLGHELLYLRNATQLQTISLSKRVDAILRQDDLRSRSSIVLEEHNEGQRLTLKLDEINLTELARLIYKIEHSKPVIMIATIDISRSYKNKKLFRVTVALISN